MNRAAALVYGLSLAAATALHFGHRAIENYAQDKHYRMLRRMFNARIQELASAEERAYYVLARKLVLYSRYFAHLDLAHLIAVCSKENHDIMRREWSGLRTRPRDLFLVFSAPYSLGIFLPVFLPIALHLLKAARAAWRAPSGPQAPGALRCRTL